MAYFKIVSSIVVNWKPIASFILVLSYDFFVIALLAVSLVIRGFFPVNQDLIASVLQTNSFKNGVTLIVALGFPKASAILLKQSRYVRFDPFNINRWFFISENNNWIKASETSITSTYPVLPVV